MPDPLAPLRPGDPISSVFAAARHNAYAHAARVVAGSGPVRWARRPKRRGKGKHLWVFAQLTEDLLPRQSAEARVCANGHPPIPTDEHITVWDYRLSSNVKLASGTIVQAALADAYDRYYVTNAYSTT